MSSTYHDGHAAGAEKARAELLANRRIAVKWARARMTVIAQSVGHSDYAAGYLDGYRSVLTDVTKGTDKEVGNPPANR